MTPHIHRLPDMILIDHEFKVPLDHARPEGETINVFAREAVATDKEKHDLPWLVFFKVARVSVRYALKTRAVG